MDRNHVAVDYVADQPPDLAEKPNIYKEEYRKKEKTMISSLHWEVRPLRA
jgi:hypothetical protein